MVELEKEELQTAITEYVQRQLPNITTMPHQANALTEPEVQYADLALDMELTFNQSAAILSQKFFVLDKSLTSAILPS